MKYLWQRGDVTATVLLACDKNSSAAALPAAPGQDHDHRVCTGQQEFLNVFS